MELLLCILIFVVLAFIFALIEYLIITIRLIKFEKVSNELERICMEEINIDELRDSRAERCKTCFHTPVCGRDMNTVGTMYVSPSPMFFSKEYRDNAWKKYLEREQNGFPCSYYIPMEKVVIKDED